MKSVQQISIQVLTAMAALALSACGGGGSSVSTNSGGAGGAGTGGGSNTNTTITTMTGVNGFKVNYTPNFPSATGWTGHITRPVTYTSSTGINSFEVADGASPAHSYLQSGGGSISAGTFAMLGATNLGGTTYSYARFGWLGGSTTESDGSTTAWYTPFALASSTPSSPTHLSYTGTKQASVYLQADRSGTLSGASGYAICDTSASYTASSKALQVTLSNCSAGVGFTTTGGFTLSNGTGTTTLAAQQIQSLLPLQTMTSASVDSGNFLLAGPNGEELVGAATIKGSIALANGTGSSNPALFFVIFGGKKQ